MPGPRNDIVDRPAWLFWALRLADALLYATVLTSVVIAVVAPLSLATGGSLVGVKWALFLLGFPLMAGGSWKLRPSAAWRDEGSRLDWENTRGEGKLQGIVDSLPPLRGRRLRDTDRLSDGTKLFLTGSLMLVVSFLLEALFGVPG
jgi:hypothetical protein